MSSRQCCSVCSYAGYRLDSHLLRSPSCQQQILSAMPTQESSCHMPSMITQPAHHSSQKSLLTSNIDFLVANRQKNPRAVVRNRASDLDLLLSTPTATPIVRQGRCKTALPVGCAPVIETSSEHGDEGFSPNPTNDPSGIGQNIHTFQSSNPSSTLPVPLSLLDLDVGAPLSGDSPACPLNPTALTESDRVIFNISQHLFLNITLNQSVLILVHSALKNFL